MKKTREKENKNLNIMAAQSLLELLVAVAIGVILIGGSVSLMEISLKTYNSTKRNLQANVLLREAAQVIHSSVVSDWHSIYDLNKGADYKISLSGATWIISAGQEEGEINGLPYKRYFRATDVLRDGSGNISESGNSDPSTQKITVFVNYENNYLKSASVSFFITRSSRNKVFQQTDWSGGEGVSGPVLNLSNQYYSSSGISTSTVGQIVLISTSTPGELISSTFDAESLNGAGLNSLLWQGNLGTGGAVKFQIAFSENLDGPWTYYGPTSTSDWYQPNPGISISFPISGSASPQNKRFFRYKVWLSTDNTSPRVDDIIINWSP